MKFGIRECCDVVFRAKSAHKIGNKTFFKDEPVVYFDTLKTSTLEGAATTVYAQGGKGNPRLIAWDGERTLTFTMEDALISPEGLAILTGAGLIEAGTGDPIYVHCTTEIPYEKWGTTVTLTGGKITIADLELGEEATIAMDTIAGADPIPHHGCYVMIKDGDGEIIAEPCSSNTKDNGEGKVIVGSDGKKISVAQTTAISSLENKAIGDLKDYSILVDYYAAKLNAMQIDIEPDRFSGNYYIEAETLFRDQATGADYPAEFIIPNGKIQSNFTFTMSGSGDPSTFTFTVDALKGRVKGGTKDVLAAIQIIREAEGASGLDEIRDKTIHQ